MEKAKLSLSEFIKQNLWGLIVAATIIISNYTITMYRIDELHKLVQDHETRLRMIELKHEKMSEQISDIKDDVRYIRDKVDTLK